VDRPRADCFNEITELLESLDAVRMMLTEGPGRYRSAVWRLHGSNVHLTVVREDDGSIAVQTGDRVPMRGETFLRKILAIIERLAAPLAG